MGLMWILERKIRQHHLRGVRQRLWCGEGAARGRRPAAGSHVRQQDANIQVPAHVRRVAVQASDERGQVHHRGDEDRSRLAPAAQVQPGVEVDVQRALYELSGRAENWSNA